jgi:nucleoside-diphosphate-sugar epimerase
MNMVVSILGCGWLGSALGEHLVEKGYEVKGSVTKQHKLEGLKAAGISGFLVNLTGEQPLDEHSDFWNCDALVVASNVNLQGNTGYMTGLQEVATIIASRQVSRIIVVSSTSIYGEPNAVVDESTIPSPQTPAATRLFEIENFFLSLSGTRATIMRCGGLVGPGRMPGSFLAGKHNIPNGLAPVNLVHLTDCIGIIECLLQSSEMVAAINAVAPDHPSRFEFYTTAAKLQGLPLPGFLLEKSSWKVVQSSIAEKLKYRYQVNHWESWLT